MAEEATATLGKDPDPERFHELVNEHIEDPYPVYRSFREASGGVHRIERSGRGPEWIVLGYDHGAAVLGSRSFGRRAAEATGRTGSIIPSRFATLSTLVDNWLVFMDPPRHTWVRTVISDPFTERLRAGMPARVAGIVDDLAARLAGRREIELVGDFAALVPMAVILEVLGVPGEDRTVLAPLLASLQEGSSWRPGPPEQRMATADGGARGLVEYFHDAVASRRHDPRPDLLSALAAADWGDEPDPEELLVGTCVHLLAAGQEATTNAVAKAALMLLRHPDLVDRLHADPDLVPRAVDEFIRYDSPGQMVHRWAYQDERLGEMTIPKGEKVTVVLGSANRDPARFENPDVIDIDRDARKHCGFGLGAHYCLGSPLGRLAVRAGVHALLKLVPDLRLAEERVPYRRDLVFHGPARLPLVRTA